MENKGLFKINSSWTKETGRWDNTKNTFVDRKKTYSEKIIHVALKNDEGRKLLQFIGGPTGFETYELESLNEIVTGIGNFCLCGGTLNSWQRCDVKSADLRKIVDEMMTK